MRLDIGDAGAEPGDHRAGIGVAGGPATQEVDADVDRLGLDARLERVLDGTERGEFEQAGNRAAVEVAGPPDHRVGEGHDPEQLSVLPLPVQPEQLGIRGKALAHRARRYRRRPAAQRPFASGERARQKPAMVQSLYDQAAERLRAGHPAEARPLFRRAADAGERKAAVVHANMLASGAGGPRDWPEALRLLRALAQTGRRSAAELALVEAMHLDAEGDPVALPEPEMLSAAPHLVRFRALFSAGECAYLMAAAGPMLAPSVVVDPASGAQRPDPVRRCDTAGFTLPLENPAVHALNRRLAAASGTAPGQGEPLQVLRYRPGGEYRGHFDAIPGFRNQRVATFLVWLNDGYQGGETHFPTAGLTLRGAPGDAILFRNVDVEGRPEPASAHAGLPVVSGEKWLASRWIRARAFDYADPR